MLLLILGKSNLFPLKLSENQTFSCLMGTQKVYDLTLQHKFFSLAML